MFSPSLDKNSLSFAKFSFQTYGLRANLSFVQWSEWKDQNRQILDYELKVFETHNFHTDQSRDLVTREKIRPHQIMIILLLLHMLQCISQSHLMRISTMTNSKKSILFVQWCVRSSFDHQVQIHFEQDNFQMDLVWELIHS